MGQFFQMDTFTRATRSPESEREDQILREFGYKVHGPIEDAELAEGTVDINRSIGGASLTLANPNRVPVNIGIFEANLASITDEQLL